MNFTLEKNKRFFPSKGIKYPTLSPLNFRITFIHFFFPFGTQSICYIQVEWPKQGLSISIKSEGQSLQYLLQKKRFKKITFFPACPTEEWVMNWNERIEKKGFTQETGIKLFFNVIYMDAKSFSLLKKRVHCSMGRKKVFPGGNDKKE